MRILSIGFGLCMLADIAFAEGDYLQIHRVFCHKEDQIEAARRMYPHAFDHGLITMSFNQLKIGPSPEVRDFGNFCKFIELFKSRGVDMQIAVSTTIGHQDKWTFRGDYPMMVGADGTKARAMACPRSRKIREYVRKTYADYAALRPSVIWMDDDLRMHWHPAVDHPCFCEDCLKRFASEFGIDADRKRLARALLDDGTIDGKRVRVAWREYNRRALNDLVVTAEKAVHEVDRGISIGFMVCNYNNPRGQYYTPPDFKSWIDIAGASGAKVWFRLGSGTYTDCTPYDDRHGFIFKNILIGRACAITEGDRVVNLAEEVTSPYIRRTKSMRLTFLEAVLNIGMAGVEGTIYDAIKPNLDEQLLPDSVVAEMNRRYPELDRMLSLVRGKRQLGAYPEPLPDPWLTSGKVESLRDACDPGPEKWVDLLYLGIPVTFRESNACARIENREWPKALARREGEEIKDSFDRLAGGRMPSRIDSILRIGQSVWESPDGKERVVFVYNFDFDDAKSVRLTENGRFAAERLNADGSWSALGTGDVFELKALPAWSAAVVRLVRQPGE